MSDAKVRFSDMAYSGLDRDEAQPEPGQEVRFGFACPKHVGRRCNGLLIAGRTDIKRDPLGQNGGKAQWDFDGNRDAPTFSPSVNCGGCWHGYIRNGRCVDTNGQDEPEPST